MKMLLAKLLLSVLEGIETIFSKEFASIVIHMLLIAIKYSIAFMITATIVSIAWLFITQSRETVALTVLMISSYVAVVVNLKKIESPNTKK